MVKLENILTCNSIQTEQVVFRSVYVYIPYACTYMHIMIIKEKRDHEFIREQGMVYRMVCREEQKGGNNEIILYYDLKLKHN